MEGRPRSLWEQRCSVLCETRACATCDLLFLYLPTAESFGVSAQIGSGWGALPDNFPSQWARPCHTY